MKYRHFDTRRDIQRDVVLCSHPPVIVDRTDFPHFFFCFLVRRAGTQAEEQHLVFT